MHYTGAATKSETQTPVWTWVKTSWDVSENQKPPDISVRSAFIYESISRSMTNFKTAGASTVIATFTLALSLHSVTSPNLLCFKMKKRKTKEGNMRLNCMIKLPHNLGTVRYCSLQAGAGRLTREDIKKTLHLDCQT